MREITVIQAKPMTEREIEVNKPYITPSPDFWLEGCDEIHNSAQYYGTAAGFGRGSFSTGRERRLAVRPKIEFVGSVSLRRGDKIQFGSYGSINHSFTYLGKDDEGRSIAFSDIIYGRCSQYDLSERLKAFAGVLNTLDISIERQEELDRGYEETLEDNHREAIMEAEAEDEREHEEAEEEEDIGDER